MSFGKQGPGYCSLPSGGSPTDTEAWALIECARKLSEARNAPDPATAITDALHLNWRLWSIFQTNLAAEHCGTPEHIRCNMLTLCQFVDKHTVETLMDPTPERIRALIDLDRNIAAGLLAGKDAAMTQETITRVSIDIVG